MAFHLQVRRERGHSQSPVDTETGGDGTSMLFWISEALVNIDQFLKINEIANCFAQSSFVVKIAQTFSI
jgi:hypothetical protein